MHHVRTLPVAFLALAVLAILEMVSLVLTLTNVIPVSTIVIQMHLALIVPVASVVLASPDMKAME